LETTCAQKYFEIQSNHWQGFVTSPGNLVGFQNQTITWDEITIPMNDPKLSIEEGYKIHESPVLYEATE